MKKDKIQYAQPIKVSDIKESFHPERGYAGYDVEVIFKDRTNIPHPYHMDPEHIHLFTDLNGTSRVVYSFPFIGYGIINWGKLAAKRWANKMRKQINPGNLEPLYELYDEKTNKVICSQTNHSCICSGPYYYFINKKSSHPIPKQEINHCAKDECPIWHNYVKELKKKIKQK